MKKFKSLLLLILVVFTSVDIFSQANPSAGILPLNPGGIVAVGAVQDIEVSITNTLSGNIVASKLRPNITVPLIATILPNAQQTGLPPGWVIVSNIGDGTIRVCNGTDVIGGGQTRNVIIKVQGTTIGVDPNLQVQIGFGGTTCAVTGPQPSGNVGADDFASATLTVVAAAACSIGVSASAGTIACNGGTTTLTATATGATGAVEYSLNGGAFQPGNTFTVNAAGSPYTVTAREVATTTCTASSTVTVAQPTAVIATAVLTTPIPTIGGTGAITVSATGGTAGATTYDITSGTSNSNTSGDANGIYTGLLAGTYTFTVTKAGCLATTTSLVLSNPAACIITSVSASAGTIACNGGTTTLTATALPAGTTYEYSVNGGAFQSGNTFTVTGGTYTVTAREVSNPVCTQTSAAVVISNPTLVVAAAVVSTPIAIPGGTGAITVSATGGTAGTTSYVINAGSPTINTTGAASGVFTGLAAGAYTFTVTKASCTAIASVNLLAPGIAKADPAVGQMFFTTPSGAVQNANTLLLAPSADLYDINIPFYNLNQVSPVPNGTIRFTVNLGSKLVLAPLFNLATAPLSAYFAWTQAVVGSNVILTGTQTATIPADFDATATFRVKGDSACRSNVVSNIVITNLLQTLTDDDLNNNLATLQYTLPITLTKTSQVNITCNGLANGIMTITASSGTSVLTTGPSGYSNTTGLASGNNTFTLSNLAPGTYTVTASSTSDVSLAPCSVTTTVIILQPTLLTIANNTADNTNNSCFGESAGSIKVTAAGGTAPYIYTIVRTVPGALSTPNTTGVNSGIFTGLPAGTYTVTVTDNNGCAVATSTAIVITQPVGGTPDITLGSDISGSLFVTPGVTQTIVFNIAEINGTSSVGDTLRITKVAGFTINFNPTSFSTSATGTTYALDNTRWKIDNSNPAFVSIILTDPSNPGAPGVLLCNQLVRVAVTLTRNTSNISTFPLSARLRQSNGEVNLANNLNSIVFTAD